MKHEELESLYKKSESVDTNIFAEQRSNVLLASSEHYNRRNSKYWSRVRDNRDLNDQQKIRITKNHIQKICKTYINNILTQAPGVKVLPKTDSELQDVKAAELHNSVLDDLKTRHNMREKIRQWVKDFVEIGECCVKVFFDPMKGQFLGYGEKTDETGSVMVDEMGQPVPDEKKPLFTGDFVFERVFGFNLMRDPQAKDMFDSKYLIIRKMVSLKDMEARLQGDEERLRMLEEGRDETYIVFDNAQNGFSDKSGQLLLKEYYFRPSPEFPQGYFYITTNKGILWEGELPFGIFPIHYVGFDDIQTSARACSIIKILRPYQANINRKASAQAESEMILGQDKILIQSGTKIANGGFLPGVRAVTFTGAPPTILPGRTGDQYYEGIAAEIEEMYKISGVFEDTEEKGEQDPLLSLFKSMRQKKKFVVYVEKFENFLVNLFQNTLELAKNYYTEDMLVPVIGKKEYVNIAEFKSTDKLCYQIKVDPMGDDVDTMMGKQLTFQHVLQYSGGQLNPEQIGVLVRNMPYANSEETFSDLTLDYDGAKNDMLALDRGEPVQVNRYDNHEYMVKKLTNRMKMADFKFLPPEIQALYQQTIQQHEEAIAQIGIELKQAQSQFIPSGGFMVKCDFYVSDSKDPNKTSRVSLPSESIAWLVDMLEKQGSSQEALAGLAQGAQGDIATMVSGGGQQGMETVPPEGQLSPQDQALMAQLQGQ